MVVVEKSLQFRFAGEGGGHLLHESAGDTGIFGQSAFEGAMICFLLAGFIALQKDRILPGAVCWSLATASKLIPLMLLPAVWKWLGWQKGVRFIILFRALFGGTLQSVTGGIA